MTDQLQAGIEIGHPTRLRILRAMAQGPQSPKTMATRQEPLCNIAYHFRVLRERGLIEVWRRVPRHGSVQTFYALTEAGRELVG